jgi:hypothetical protein
VGVGASDAVAGSGIGRAELQRRAWADGLLSNTLNSLLRRRVLRWGCFHRPGDPPAER